MGVVGYQACMIWGPLKTFSTRNGRLLVLYITPSPQCTVLLLSTVICLVDHIDHHVNRELNIPTTITYYTTVSQ